RVVARMTAEEPRAAVLRERDAARGAHLHRAARLAAEARREAAPIEEEDRLAFRREAALERAVERRGDERVPARRALVPREVDDLDARERPRRGAVGHREQRDA